MRLTAAIALTATSTAVSDTSDVVSDAGWFTVYTCAIPDSLLFSDSVESSSSLSSSSLSSSGCAAADL